MLKRTPIIPGDGLYLWSAECYQEERFVQIFKTTWEKISEGVRQSLVRYWGKDPHREAAMRESGGDCPFILFGNRACKHMPWTTAYVDPFGCILRFSASIIELMPNKIVGLTIAHELGHVHCYAVNELLHLQQARKAEQLRDNALPQDQEISDRIEKSANEAAREFGFDCTELDRWQCDPQHSDQSQVAVEKHYTEYGALMERFRQDHAVGQFPDAPICFSYCPTKRILIVTDCKGKELRRYSYGSS